MTIQKWIFGFGVLTALHCHGLSAFVQEPNLLSPASPKGNLIDPAALVAPPLFGDSGPVIKPRESDANVEVTPENETRWMPKLQVLLVTSATEQTEVIEPVLASNDPFAPTPDSRNPAIRQTTRAINVPFMWRVVLMSSRRFPSAAGEMLL